MIVKGARVGLLLVVVAGLLTPTAHASADTVISSFNAGVLAPNQSKHVWWNNANSDAYAPGLFTVDVDDPADRCTATITRTWYVRQPSGEREFHLSLLGDTRHSCQVQVRLARLTAFRTSSLGSIPAGGSVTRVWNNAHLESNVYLMGAVPSVPTGSAPCSAEVTPRWSAQPNGETRFAYTTTNTGSTACSVDLRMVSLPVITGYDTTSLQPGGTDGIGLFTRAGMNLVVQGMNPWPVPDGTCQGTISAPRSTGDDEIMDDYTNSGGTTCRATATYWYP